MQNRALNMPNSLVAGAVLLGFIAAVAWFFRPPSIPVSPGSASFPTRVNRTFGNTIALLNYGLNQDVYRAGDAAILTLYWQARVVPQTSYTVFIHLQDAKQGLQLQSNALPVNGTRPTSSWKPDEVIEDRREIILPSTLAAGQYKVIVGLFDPNTGTRLNTSDGNNELMLTTLEIR